jgi:hypothetical protein
VHDRLLSGTPARTEIQLRDWAMGPVVHHYLALRAVAHDASGRVVEDRSLAEIHGLATMASRPDKALVNTFELGGGSNLHAYWFDGEFLPGLLNQVIAAAGTGGAPEESQALEAAFRAAFAEADASLNAMGLRYQVARQNSNTVARWVAARLAERLGRADPVHPGLWLRRPGWRNDLARPVLERHKPRGRSWPRPRLPARLP